jgi:hypothetical protein
MSGRSISDFSVANATWPGFREDQLELLPPVKGLCGGEFSISPVMSSAEVAMVSMAGALAVDALTGSVRPLEVLGGTVSVQEEGVC